MREGKLTELRGNSRLALGFFNSIIRRIECTKPLAGTGITILEKENGYEISSSGGGSVVSGGSIDGYSEITLNACVDGEPTSIIVLGKLTQEDT